MNWSRRPPGSRGQLSTCERYSVAQIGDRAGQFYEAWRTRRHERGLKLLATRLGSVIEARRVCESDAEAAP